MKRVKLLFRIVIFFSFICFSSQNAFTNDNTASQQGYGTEDIVKFTVTPVTLRLFPGGSMQLIATAYNSKGEKVTVTPSWTLKSDIPLLGEFNKTEGERVIFNAINSGNGSIIVIYNDLEAEIQVKIYKSKRKIKKR